jgi:hypothetical protein
LRKAIFFPLDRPFTKINCEITVLNVLLRNLRPPVVATSPAKPSMLARIMHQA